MLPLSEGEIRAWTACPACPARAANWAARWAACMLWRIGDSRRPGLQQDSPHRLRAGTRDSGWVDARQARAHAWALTRQLRNEALVRGFAARATRMPFAALQKQFALGCYSPHLKNSSLETLSRHSQGVRS